MAKKDIETITLYKMQLITYLDVFIDLAGAMKKQGERKYFTEIRKAFHLALNNNYIKTDDTTTNDLLIFILKNNYTLSELRRLSCELFLKKFLNKAELELLTDRITKFKRKSKLIENRLIKESGINAREFV